MYFYKGSKVLSHPCEWRLSGNNVENVNEASNDLSNLLKEFINTFDKWWMKRSRVLMYYNDEDKELEITLKLGELADELGISDMLEKHEELGALNDDPRYLFAQMIVEHAAKRACVPFGRMHSLAETLRF